MEKRSLDLVPPRFHLSEDIIPETLTHRIQYANHGKAIARNSAGIWFGAFMFDRRYPDRTWLAVCVSRTPSAEGGDFHPPILLSGRSDPPWRSALFECGSGLIGNVCALMDEKDRLHVFYDHPDGVFHHSADASGSDPHARLSSASAWTPPERVADAGNLLGDVAWLPGERIALYLLRGGALHERVLGQAETLVAENAERPNLFIEPSGVRHVAFERDRRIFYIRSNDGRSWADSRGNPRPEMAAYFCSSYPSIAVTGNGQVVIAYQGEGKVDLKRNPALYDSVRAAGGCTVSYAVLGADGWRVEDFLRSSEILLKRKGGNAVPLRNERFVPFMEEFWHPALSVDRHGVVWMFYLNTTRRHVFFTRFGGEKFGDQFEARGPYDCLSRTLFVQKLAQRTGAIGMMAVASKQVYFDAIETPSYRSAEPRRIVFLDNLEVDEQVGVEHRIEQWKKDRRRVFGYGVNGSDEHVCFCKVLPVPGGYEMRYAALETLYTNSMRGRAFSRDGLHWERREPVDESAMTLDGKHWPSWFCRVIFLEDPQEKNPNRRFKGLYPNWRDIAGLQVRTWDVVASADAIHWETVPEVQPVVLGDYSTNYHLYRDEEDRDPRRRYKAVMVIACNAGRNPVIYTSPDLIHWDGVYKMREEPERMDSPLSPWETGPIVIDPDAAENPWEEEVHDALIWREHGLLMYHYDAFYFGANQHVNKALALSRDGRHYWRVRRGAINMPHGNCGEWDNGRVRTSPPIRVGDELWIHFVGMPAGNFGDPDRDDPTNTVTRAPSPDDHKKFKEIRPWSVGLARLRVDGWASFRLHPDRETGHVTTVPFEYTGGALVVNGSGLGAGGIRVEVRRADNRAAVPGYEGAKSEFSSPDAVSSKVTWKGAKPFASGKYRLRFIFDHVRARLFAFGFE